MERVCFFLFFFFWRGGGEINKILRWMNSKNLMLNEQQKVSHMTKKRPPVNGLLAQPKSFWIPSWRKGSPTWSSKTKVSQLSAYSHEYTESRKNSNMTSLFFIFIPQMGPVWIGHRSCEFTTQASHSVHRAGWQAKMASIEIWMRRRKTHMPHCEKHLRIAKTKKISCHKRFDHSAKHTW